MKNKVLVSCTGVILCALLLSACGKQTSRKQDAQDPPQELLPSTYKKKAQAEPVIKKTEPKPLQEKKVVVSKKERSPEPPESRNIKPVSHKKTVQPDEQQAEVLLLNGEQFVLPKQWQGKKMTEPEATRATLQMIPRQYVFEEKSVYLFNKANQALQIMIEAAREDGVELQVHSAFRSSRYQRQIFLRMMEEGRSFDDIIRYVAPPGYSEHALGTVVDFYPSNWYFAKTPGYAWLKENGQRFDFSESYPENGDMPWESWHWRWKRMSTP